MLDETRLEARGEPGSRASDRIEFERYEVVKDRIVDDPYLDVYESRIASRLVRPIDLDRRIDQMGTLIRGVLFVLERSPRLWRRPDIAFVSNERWPPDRPLPRDEAWDVIPDLAIEILSQYDPAPKFLIKLEEYFRVGVRSVWAVSPDVAKVYVYESPTSVRILQVGDELEGGTILPCFRLPLSQVFETKKGGPTPVA